MTAAFALILALTALVFFCLGVYCGIVSGVHSMKTRILPEQGYIVVDGKIKPMEKI